MERSLGASHVYIPLQQEDGQMPCEGDQLERAGKTPSLGDQHVYNAFEGTVLGGKIVTKEIPRSGSEYKTLSILMVRDGKMLGKNSPGEAREAFQWFETLMKE